MLGTSIGWLLGHPPVSLSPARLPLLHCPTEPRGGFASL